MTNYTDYTNYLSQLAAKFLGHTSEEKHFFRKGLEEFLNGLTTNVKYPALLLDNYDYKYTDNGADNIQKARTVAFVVCVNVPDIEDYEAIDAAKDYTEDLCDKIYSQIRKDIRPSSEHEYLKYARLGEVMATPVENKGDGNYGYYVTIEIFSHHNATI